MSTLQIYNDEKVGQVQFRDNNEQTPSVKCKLSDIKIIDKHDRAVASRLRREIAAEINAYRLPAGSK